MARVSGPVISIGGKGQIGKSLIFSDWRGVKYAKQYVVPANPQTAEQSKTRDVFSYSSDFWRMATADAKKPWTEYAKNRPFTDRNSIIGKNVLSLRGKANNNDLVISPGVRSGPVLVSISAVTGAAAGQINVTATEGTTPTGWTLDRVVWVLVKQQDPTVALIGQVFSSVDTATPFSATVSGLTAGAVYVVGAFPEYTTDTGRYAAGASINTTATAHA